MNACLSMIIVYIFSYETMVQEYCWFSQVCRFYIDFLYDKLYLPCHRYGNVMAILLPAVQKELFLVFNTVILLVSTIIINSTFRVNQITIIFWNRWTFPFDKVSPILHSWVEPVNVIILHNTFKKITDETNKNKEKEKRKLVVCN